MNHALLLNLMIVLAIILVIVTQNNPLALLGILLLQPMPYSLLVNAESEKDPKPNSMGFIHDD